MIRKTVQIVTRGNVFKKLQVMLIDDAPYVASYVINPRNRGIFKKFDKECVPNIAVNGTTFYALDSVITDDAVRNS